MQQRISDFSRKALSMCCSRWLADALKQRHNMGHALVCNNASATFVAKCWALVAHNGWEGVSPRPCVHIYLCRYACVYICRIYVHMSLTNRSQPVANKSSSQQSKNMHPLCIGHAIDFLTKGRPIRSGFQIHAACPNDLLRKKLGNYVCPQHVGNSHINRHLREVGIPLYDSAGFQSIVFLQSKPTSS